MYKTTINRITEASSLPDLLLALPLSGTWSLNKSTYSGGGAYKAAWKSYPNTDRFRVQTYGSTPEQAVFRLLTLLHCV